MMTTFHCAIVCVLFVGILSGKLPQDYCVGCPVEVWKNSEDVQKDIMYVLQKLGPGHKLLWIERAQTQLVNGVNFILFLRMEKNGLPQSCRAVVHHRLDGTREYLENRSNC